MTDKNNMKQGKNTSEFGLTVAVIAAVTILASIALLTGQVDEFVNLLDALWKPVAVVAVPYIGGRSYIKASQGQTG